MKIGFIGLGKLGLPIAEVIATKHQVTGFDIAPRTSKLFTITHDIQTAILHQDLIFLAVQTPHEKPYDGSRPLQDLPLRDFDYTLVKKCLQEIIPHLQEHQTVCLISTVLPGTIRRELAPLFPPEKKCNFIYNPFLIAMGTEQNDFLHPEMVIMGSSDGTTESLASLRDFYLGMMKNQPRLVEGTWEEAEAIKIFYNTFISAKLSLVNMVLDVSEKLGHMNVDIVTQALAESTQRIMSPAYMKAGMGDGGPCHPRDNIALRWLSQELKLGYDLFGAIIQSREQQANNLACKLLEYSKNIVILGKAYKPHVPYTDGSYSLLVGDYILNNGGKVHYIDPMTQDLSPSPFPEDDQVFLIALWDTWVWEYSFPKGSIVIDPWRSKQRLRDVRHIDYGNTR
jgi:UDPglucose 6-dehydrogenase